SFGVQQAQALARRLRKTFHLAGRKTDYNYRLDTPDRIGQAGIHKIGLGVLLGLEDWRTDSFFCALHQNYLQKNYWKTKYSISFPRLRPHVGSFKPPHSISDAQFVQLICAYRLFNPDLELSLSTREMPLLRDNMIQLGITAMSAGSSTAPGGYADDCPALEQFEVGDSRSPVEMCQTIKKHGYEAVWKDWDGVYSKH
ncbi:MAG: 2-iminoacetate synthase ThiH, partial [Bacteroidales bacterium]